MAGVRSTDLNFRQVRSIRSEVLLHSKVMIPNTVLETGSLYALLAGLELAQ